MRTMSPNADKQALSNFSSRKSLDKSKQQNNKVLTLNKGIENVEYLLRVADKNKRQLQESYGKQIEKVEKAIEKKELELKEVLREMNEKESQIYEIQKVKLEGFKNELAKFEKTRNELDHHSHTLDMQLSNSHTDKTHLYNQTMMIYEDYLSINNEATMSRQKIIDLKDTLSEIEKSYPKDFEFLFEDIQLERQVRDLDKSKKETLLEIKELEVRLHELNQERHDKEDRKALIAAEFKKVDDYIEESYKSSTIAALEDYIYKNCSDVMKFSNLKKLVTGKLIYLDYYLEKNLDIENELNILVIKNLAEKCTEMKNEFYQIKNDKMIEKNKVDEELKELKSMSMTGNLSEKNKRTGYKSKSSQMNPMKLLELIKQKEDESEKIKSEVNLLELNCKKKETLFNKYIILLRNKCTKSEEESYFRHNPALILETHFEENLKMEILEVMKRTHDYASEDEIKKHEGTIEIYFKELFERERKIQLVLIQRTKLEETLNEFQSVVSNLSDQIADIEYQIQAKKLRLQEVEDTKKNLHMKIEARNRNLKASLENLGESQFMEYLNSNETALKKMKSIYGNKVLTKVFKQQKEKFLENVMLDHSFKKSKINEFVSLVNQFEIMLERYKSLMEVLLDQYKQQHHILEQTEEYIERKEKEKAGLGLALAELNETIESMLKSEMEEITKEKVKLRYKLNSDFCFVKVKEITQKIENLRREKLRILNEFAKFKDVITEREQKLYMEDLVLKNNLVSANLGEEISSKAEIPYKVNPHRLNQFCESEIPAGLSSPMSFDSQEMATLSKKVDNVILSKGEESNISPVAVTAQELVKEKEPIVIDLNSGDENADDLDMEISENGNLFNLDERLLNQQNSELRFLIDKVKPLAYGITIYKKFSSEVGRSFDPNLAEDFPPEKCGYAIRSFKLIPTEAYIEIRRNKNIEMKIQVLDLKSVFITPQTKNQIDKYKKKVASKPNSDSLLASNKETTSEFVMFKLVLHNSSVDMIAKNFIQFITVQEAIEELVSQKKSKNIQDFLAYVGEM